MPATENTIYSPEGATPPAEKPSLFRQKMPFIIVLILAVAGVAYTSMAGQPLYGYWEFLALAIGGVCIVIDWRGTDQKEARLRLAGIQILHWLAFIVAMNMLLLPSVSTFLNGPATGLALMLLLALGTFVAGIRTSRDIAFLGIAMALTVPAIAWLKSSALFMFLMGLVVVGLGVAFWPSGKRSSA